MEKILAIDYGRARIGLAISAPLGIVGRPLPAVDARDRDAALREIAELCQEEQVARVVVGIPLRMDGTEGEAVQEVRQFLRLLGARFSLPIEEVDERLTSRAAHALLKDAGVRHKKRKQKVDSSAALLMLQDYLSRTR